MQHSDSIAKLAPALVAFQAEITNPPNTAVNPFLKNRYAPLHDIINHVRPVLARHGLAVTQMPTGDGIVGVTTMLVHSSGEYIMDTVGMQGGTEKGKSDAQVAGSIISYLRRYALSAVLGIASEDDNDGNNGHRPPPEPKKPQPRPDASKLESKPPAKMEKGELAAAFDAEAKGVPDEQELRSDARAAWRMEDMDRMRELLTRVRAEKTELF